LFGIEHFLIFMSSALLLGITPGPDMLYVATRSTTQGRMAGFASAMGIWTGTLVHITAAMLGISAILSYSALAFTIVKWLGAGYLVYLGVKSILTANEPLTGKKLKCANNWQIYRQAIVVNMLNPKVALFFLAFLPQFTNPETGNVNAQILFLGMVFNFTGTFVNIMVGFSFGSVGGWILNRPTVRKVQAWITGTIFIGLGINLALAEQR